ncbi:MAG: hypothetical protein CL489_02875 [Acidobacteria bacterium]|nr:hypothetical protein [Acidobacteriota bacterium]
MGVTESESTTAKRNFYLMLSPPDGQDVAANNGFYPSSEDVYEEEQKDILRSWAILTQAGIVDSMSDAADWMADVMVNDNMLPPEDMDDADIVTVGFDMDHPGSDDFATFQTIPFGELRKMHQQIKESTYNTVLGCLISGVSKLLDEELIELTTV